jgi:cation transport ATPase
MRASSEPAAPQPRRAAPSRASIIAVVATVGIAVHLALRLSDGATLRATELPLYVVLFGGGVPFVVSLALKLIRGQFGSDLLAGIPIVAATLTGEYLAGALVVLMLSGGEALEGFALGRASSVLQALAPDAPDRTSPGRPRGGRGFAGCRGRR